MEDVAASFAAEADLEAMLDSSAAGLVEVEDPGAEVEATLLLLLLPLLPAASAVCSVAVEHCTVVEDLAAVEEAAGMADLVDWEGNHRGCRGDEVDGGLRGSDVFFCAFVLVPSLLLCRCVVPSTSSRRLQSRDHRGSPCLRRAKHCLRVYFVREIKVSWSGRSMSRG